MFNPFSNNPAGGVGDDPFNLPWATDPIDGDVNFNFDWNSIDGTDVNPFGNSDLGLLWKELEAMQNNAGAGDNLPQILATIIKIGQMDKSSPAAIAFFAKYGNMFKALVDAELLLIYAQNVKGGMPGSPDPGKYDPANGEFAITNFVNKILSGPLNGVSVNDPIRGSIVKELIEDSTQGAFNLLRTQYWGANPDGTGWTYFQIPGDPKHPEYPSQDGHPINLETDDTDGSLFAEYVFGDVLYKESFGDSKYADATTNLFMTMFEQVFTNSKDPIYLFMALMTMFGSFKDEDYQDSLQGYGYTSNWLSKHQDDLQRLVQEFNTPGYFGTPGTQPGEPFHPRIDPATGKTYAEEWMTSMRRLFIDTEFNPNAKSLQSNMYSVEQAVFNMKDPHEGDTIGNYYYDSNDDFLAQALDTFSQGIPASTDPKHPVVPIPPDHTIIDNLQTETKTLTDHAQATQTEMSATSSNDNTIVNTLKTALGNITQLEQAINSQLTASASA